MWGLFFEDINSAADGGLYAEMVQNRSFEKSDEKKDIYIIGDFIQYIKEPNRGTANIIPPKIYRLKQINR